MLFRLLADIVLVIHTAFILYALLGGLLARRWRPAIWFHLPAVLWAALVEFTDAVCPLTPLENMLRHHARGATYDTGFIDHYLMPVLYPAALNADIRFALGITVLLVNIGIYAWVFKRAQDKRR